MYIVQKSNLYVYGHCSIAGVKANVASETCSRLDNILPTIL